MDLVEKYKGIPMHSREAIGPKMAHDVSPSAMQERKDRSALSRKLDNVWRSLAVTAQLMGCAHPHFENVREMSKTGQQVLGRDTSAGQAPKRKSPEATQEDIDAELGLKPEEIAEDDPGDPDPEYTGPLSSLDASMDWAVVEQTIGAMVREEWPKDGITGVELSKLEQKRKRGNNFLRCDVQVTLSNGTEFSIPPDGKWRSAPHLLYYLTLKVTREARRHQRE